MKNDECTIYMIIKKSGWKQKYKKVNGTWTQTTNGIVRKMTAEQLLSHLLPPLAAGKASKVAIKVQKIPKKHQKTR